MSFATHSHAAVVLLPLALAACASAPPAPIALGHPAYPDTVAAPVPELGVLRTYRDFGVSKGAMPEAAPARQQEKHDAHEH
jgi:hypothetical protein